MLLEVTHQDTAVHFADGAHYASYALGVEGKIFKQVDWTSTE